jgi:DNA-binding SARP family transcriptional activator/tetratricopeptide (TPR) repeat protein
MAAETEFCLLGPLLVRHRGIMIPVAAGKQRVLLAALLLSAGRLVTVDELAETLWGSVPPRSARASLRNYVMRLRKSLADGGLSRISTQPDGYLISVEAGELDVERFATLLADARAAARDSAWAVAAKQLGMALTLWRGPPLSDVPSSLLALREAPRLTEMRLQALEARIEADLRLGRHTDVIIELRQLAAAYPLRERLHALLMTALYRDGQQAGALAAYQAVRRVLIDELGTEPGPELRQLQRQILDADHDLPAASAPTWAAEHTVPGMRSMAGWSAPRQLPATVPHFAGRAAELRALTALLNQPGSRAPGAVVISAIGGTAGVGKTALAGHWAHQVADRFPDGQLYVNLRGYDPGLPLTSADALAGFLRALGVPSPDIPHEEGERAGLYRSLLAGRRVLVVLDNAGSAAQVGPLLPGSPTCMVVVTSRDALAGLVARDGAVRVELDLLPLPEAVGLLRALIGPRADSDPAAAAALASQCARLPLALRVAAELAAARPDLSLADLASELADQQRRLDLLDAGADTRTAVRAVFSWSYRSLSDSAARAFRLVSLHPGPDLDDHAAAALTDAPAETAARARHELVRAHLLQAAGPGRYGMHDLLCAFARELDDPAAQRVALTRLLDYYLHGAATAMDILFPAECHRRPRVQLPVIGVPPLTGQAAARAWLDAERASLVAVTAHAAGGGWPDHATRLAATLHRYLEAGDHDSDAITIHSCALSAARSTGDRAGEAAALNGLGLVDLRQGRYPQATDCHEQAMALFRETGDRNGEARALGNLGVLRLLEGRYRQAAADQKRAIALFRDLGDRVGECRALTNLGLVKTRQGRYEQAIGHYERSLAMHREIGDRAAQAYPLGNLGHVLLRLGRYPQARDHFKQALALAREHGNRTREADALAGLGGISMREGAVRQAHEQYQQALAILRATGDRPGEAETLNDLGQALTAAGQPHDAAAHHATALALASLIGDKYEQARAHNGLGCARRDTGDLDQACRHWHEAVMHYAALGVPEANEVRAQLATAGNHR